MALMYCYGSGFHVSKSRTKCEPEATRTNGVPVTCSKTSHGELEAIVRVRKFLKFCLDITDFPNQ